MQQASTLEDAFPNLQGASGSATAAEAPAPEAGESNDTRDRRIANGKLYSGGVAAWRSRVEPTDALEEHGAASRARVFVRVRPLFGHESERGEWDCVSAGAGAGVTLHEGTEMVQAGKGLVKALRHHTFTSTRPLTDDAAVFTEMSRDLVSIATGGKCATLFMLGMTGSGKTFNMNIIHERAPAELFAALGPDAQRIGLISYELVGKKSFDLLTDAKPEVQLRADAKGRIQVSGAVEQTATAAEQLVALLRAASARRETAATGANAQSSRSHAVYQLSLPGRGRLLLVDLAGNEGSIETLYHSKLQMAEAAEINASLMALKNCLHARATGALHVPFRDSTLTRVLQDALTDATATTAVLACLSPACSHFELSVRTMGVSVTLMGRDEQAQQETEVLREAGVQRGGPAKWSADELRAWLAVQPFAAAVTLPDGATGGSLMKLPVARLQQGACGGDKDAAQALFEALRLAAKEAAAKELQLRKELLEQKSRGSSRAFAKNAPAKPVAHAFGTSAANTEPAPM